MSDRYLCVHCDLRFEHDDAQALRCPKCMRKNGLEKLVEKPSAKRPTWLVPALVATAVLALAIGYVAYGKRGRGADEALAPLDVEALAEGAAALGLDSQDIARIFEADDAIERFAAEAVRGKSSSQDKGRAVVAKLHAFARASRFVSLPMHTPRESAPRTAARTFAALEPDARDEAYSLEIAALAIAALRAQDVPAMLVEVFAYPGERAPVDPSGRVGYFAVAVYEDEPGEGAPLVLDPFGGHEAAPAPEAHRVLTDVQAMGAWASIAALHLLVQQGDAAGAMERVQAAITLDPRSPSIRCARAAVLISAGGIDEGESELRAAVELRDDASRQANLAGLYIATGRNAEARAAIERAIELSPDYVYAIALEAAFHLARNETEEAKTRLERAEQLEEGFYMLPTLWAEYFLRTSQPAEAVARVRRAIDERPRDYQLLFQAARVFEAAGEHLMAITTARAALELVPADQREALRARLEQLLGAGSLSEQPSSGDEGDVAPASPGTVDDFDLSRGSRLLGGGETSPSGPRLLGGGGLRLGGP